MKRLILLTAALALGAPAAALAVTPTVTVVSSSYTFTGLSPDVDDVTIAPVSTDKVSFTVASGTITTSVPDCTGTTTATVTCTYTNSVSGVTVHGNGGNDKIRVSGGLGNHSAGLYGEAGDDQITGNAEYDYFHPGPGADTVDGGPSVTPPAIVRGYAPGSDYFPDELNYGDEITPVHISFDGVANDGIDGEHDNLVGGIESFVTGSGNDVIDLANQAGNVRVTASDGDDTVATGAGNDTVIAGDGDDNVSVGAGDDFISGDNDEGGPDDPGNDRLDGGAGNDAIDAGKGNDTEIGGPGDDIFNDSYAPDYGTDDVSGGEGEDEAWVVRWQDDAYGSPTDEISGGGGITVRSARIAVPPTPQPVNVSLDDVANDGRAGETSNIHSDVENIRTGDGNDLVTGAATANTITTGLGNDTVDPGSGADEVQAGSGDDTLVLKDGLADRGNCGAGTDTVTADEAVDALFSCENVTKVALPVPVVPTPPDTTKPTGKITGLGSTVKKKTFTKSGLKLTVTTSEPAKVAAELFATLSTGKKFGFAASVNDLQIGSSSLKLGSGARKLTLKPSAKWKARTKNRRLRLTVKLTITDAAGNVSTVTKKVRVK